MGSPASVGKSVELANSRIKTTSPAYLIAVCPEGIDEEEQDKRVRESAIFITAGFMKYNQSLQIDTGTIPDQFTMKSMTRFLAKKHGLTGQEARLIIYKDRVEMENSNIPFMKGSLIPQESVNHQKNPLISKFFLQLGWVEEIGYF